jgi:hypothetical protein
LEIENRAIGGFAAQVLVRPAEHDLYPFYPDLLIFHVYGSNGEYEQIIRNVRARTTAEILMQTDHVAARGVGKGPDETDKGLHWDWLMNHQFLPEIARKYGCGLADVRGAWQPYLAANRLEPRALLSDDVHLNAHGNFLMAEILKAHLVYRPDSARPSVDSPPVRTIPVGQNGVAWKNGRLVLPFDGNRVDLIAGPANGKPAGAARVLIDGKAPSSFPELRYITRPSGTVGVGWPAVIRVGSEAPLLIEDWTARLTNLSADAKQFSFTVTGSKTGPDGEGTSDKRFVSRSGRIVIEPQDWWLHADYNLAKKPTPEGYEVRWRVLPLFADRYAPPAALDSTREHAVTLAQGLSNGKHTLELIADDKNAPPPVAAFRVYRPPLK